MNIGTFGQNLSRRPQKGVQKWPKNGPKMGQKWPIFDPFFEPLLSGLSHYGQNGQAASNITVIRHINQGKWPVLARMANTAQKGLKKGSKNGVKKGSKGPLPICRGYPQITPKIYAPHIRIVKNGSKIPLFGPFLTHF